MPRPTYGARRARRTPSPATTEPPSPGRAAVVVSPRVWIGLYVAIFVIAQGVLFLAFQTAGGDSRLRREMLQRAEAEAAAGRPREHLDVLLDYGRRWPGAYDTGDFQKRLGDAHAALGEHRTAAEHYATSLAMRPGEPGVAALAGEQWRLAGDDQAAIDAFVAELQSGDALHPMAHHRLGLDAVRRGAWAEAMRHRAALPRDWALIEEWAPGLAEFDRIVAQATAS